jgi:hypothetical protein
VGVGFFASVIIDSFGPNLAVGIVFL